MHLLRTLLAARRLESPSPPHVLLVMDLGANDHFRARAADALMPFAAGRELARLIPDARLVVHEEAGYALILERPKKCAESILAFVAETEEALAYAG